jgi:hypothetical protein
MLATAPLSKSSLQRSCVSSCNTFLFDKDDSLPAVQTMTAFEHCYCAGGVVLGADSRTSTGSYVANRVTDKITPLAGQPQQ